MKKIVPTPTAFRIPRLLFLLLAPLAATLLVTAGCAGRRAAAADASPGHVAATPSDTEWAGKLKDYLEASRSEHNHAIKSWKEAAAWNFDDGFMPAGFKVFDGKWDVAGGKLRAISGKDDDNRTIKIANCIWPAFRLEFDAALHAKPGVPAGHVCDIGILLNANADTGEFRDGYAVLAGTYYNQATVLYRLYIPYARTEWSPIVPGKTHHIVLEVVKPHLRFWIDGRIVLEAWERRGFGPADGSDFIEMDPKRVIALHTYDTVMEVDNLRVLVPGDAGK
jgi:hypothetical protein